MKTNPNSQPVHSRRPRKGLRILLVGGLLVVILLGGLVTIPIVSPATGAAMADGLRGVIGPEAVAEIESVEFRVQDAFNRIRYQTSGGQAQISWADAANTTFAPAKSITVKPANNKANSAVKPALDRSVTAASNQPIKPVINRVTAPPVNPAASAVDVISAPSLVGAGNRSEL